MRPASAPQENCMIEKHYRELKDKTTMLRYYSELNPR